MLARRGPTSLRRRDQKMYDIRKATSYRYLLTVLREPC